MYVNWRVSTILPIESMIVASVPDRCCSAIFLWNSGTSPFSVVMDLKINSTQFSYIGFRFISSSTRIEICAPSFSMQFIFIGVNKCNIRYIWNGITLRCISEFSGTKYFLPNFLPFRLDFSISICMELGLSGPLYSSKYLKGPLSLRSPEIVNRIRNASLSDDWEKDFHKTRKNHFFATFGSLRPSVA